MNHKYRMRGLFYDKNNIIDGIEDLLCFVGCKPLLLTDKQNLWGNIKQLIKYFFETVWIKNSILKYFKVNVRNRNLKNYLRLYLAVISGTPLLLDIVLFCKFKLSYSYNMYRQNCS